MLYDGKAMDEGVFKILIAEDSFVNRIVLKKTLKLFVSSDKEKIKVYTSENGIEGLGYLFLTKPDVIIIDSSLPGFSGAELAEYLENKANEIESFAAMQVLILYSAETPPEGFEKYISFSKRNPTFIYNLINLLKINIQRISSGKNLDATQTKIITKLSKLERLSLFFASRALVWSSKASHTIKGIQDKLLIEKIFLYAVWLIRRLRTRINFTVFNFVTGDVKDENIFQGNADVLKFRVDYYPSFFIGILALVAALILVFALIFGTGELVSVKDRVENSLFPKQSEPDEVVNVFAKDSKGNLLGGTKIKVGIEEKTTDSNGVTTFKLKSGTTYEIKATKGTLSYRAETKITKSSIGYSTIIIVLD